MHIDFFIASKFGFLMLHSLFLKMWENIQQRKKPAIKYANHEFLE